MEHSFKKLAVRRFPKLSSRENSEGKFWSKFQHPLTSKDHSAATSIHFSGAQPHDFAVTSGTRVLVYSAVTNQVKKTISRFNEAAYSGCFRTDGRLLAAGSEDGVVKVFDLNSRAILRQYKGHVKPTRAVRFSRDGLWVWSASDDTTVRSWDLSTETCLTTFRGHEDYVRVLVPSPASNDVILSASYDHTLRLWDARTGGCVLVCDNDAPLEACLFFPSGGMGVSAGGNIIKIWDLVGGGRQMMSFSHHQKTITALSFDGSGQRLISGGLDKQLRVYSLEDYHVTHTMSYPAPILSMAMSPLDTHLVVGMTTKLLSIQCRPQRKDDAPPVLTPRGGTYRYFVRGKSYKPTAEEYVLNVPKKKRLQPYEKFLKKFKYKNALDAALEHRGTGKGVIVYSVLQELGRRDGLSIALSGRNEEELYPLLRYLSRNMTQPRFAPLLLDVCDMVTDIYGGILSHSKTTQALFQVLKVKVDREFQFQCHAFELLGQLDMILCAATTHQRQGLTHDITKNDSFLVT